MLEVISQNSKFITLRMPIRLGRSIFGDFIGNKSDATKEINQISEAAPTAEEAKIFKRYRNADTSKLKDISVLFKKYNFK